MIGWLSTYAHALSYLVCSLIIGGIIVFALWRRLPFGSSFVLLCMCIIIWISGVGVNYLIHPEPVLDHWFTYYYIGLSFLPIAFLYFSMHFLKLSSPWLLLYFAVLFVFSTAFSIIAIISPDFITHLHRNASSYVPCYGKTGIVFLGYLGISILVTFIAWIIKYRTETDLLQKRRIQFILFSFAVGQITFIDALPGLGINIFPSGHLIITFFLLFLTYMLFVYRVVKIQNKLITLWQQFIILILIASPWAFLLYAFSLFDLISSWKSAWLFSLISFIIFIPYFNFASHYLPQRLFKHDHNFIQQINSFSKKIITLQDPENLLVLIEKLMVNVLNLNKICISYKIVTGGAFRFRSIPGPDNTLPSCVSNMFHWFKKHPAIIFREDVSYSPDYYDVAIQLNSIFKELNVSIIVPIVQTQELLGILFLETSRLPRSWEFRFLSQLQPYLVVAMNNSFLYDNIHYLNRDLESSNRHLNNEVINRTQELENALSHMKQMHQGQSNFFNMASHHLRTPLTSIRASATLLWAKKPLPHKASLNAILNENILRLESLINNIIEIAKIENGSINLLHETIPIHQLIINAYLENEMLFQKKSLSWEFNLTAGPKIIQGDRKRIQTVLSNLFSNAFKFTPPNGHVAVCWAPASPEDIKRYELSRLLQKKAYYEFIISDNGDGIPDDEKRIIFDIFRQVKESHKRYQGPGLGLFLVKSIIETHAGAVFLESELHKGSQFSFLLPAAE